MPAIIEVKRRVGSAQSAPTGANNEGELAVYFPGAAGTTGKPTLYANDGGGWRTIVDGNDLGGIPNHDTTKAYQTGDVIINGGNIYQAPGAVGAGVFSSAQWTKITNTGGVSVKGYNAAAGATAATVEAGFNADAITVANGEVVVYSWKGSAYIYTGGTGAPVNSAVAANFTSLGAATSFATVSQVTAGTDTGNAINSKLLRDELVRAFGPLTAANLLAGAGAANTSAGVADANKLVALDATGKISPTMLSITGVNFLGAVDATAAPTVPAGGFKAGDIYFNSTAGTAEARWAGIGGTTLGKGDMLLFDGTKWESIAAEADLAKYLPLAGGTMTAGDTTKITFAPTTKDGTVTVIDLGQGKLENGYIDGGTY